MYLNSNRGDIDIAFDLTGIGWSECKIRVGGSRAHVTASYISDAPRDFLSAVIAIVRGDPSATITFWNEPGRYRWTLERISSKWVRIEILGLPDKHVVYHADCLLRDFAVEVVSAFDRLRQKYGEAGYLAKWIRDKFPTERLEELRGLLEA